jgi:cardiolipin synthase A/B
MEHMHWIAHGIYLADLVIRVGLSVRVIRRRLPVGVALAWLAIILIFPFVGAVIYLLVGEYRLGPRRARRAAAYQETSRAGSGKPGGEDRVDPATFGPGSATVARLAESALGAAVLAGNHLVVRQSSFDG